MRTARLLTIVALAGAAVLACAGCEDKTQKPLQEKLVTLQAPYPMSRSRETANEIPVDFAVMLVLKQAGIKYDRTDSIKNTWPICNQMIKPDIQALPCDRALQKILDPVGLAYKTDKDKIVLVKK